MFYTFLEGSTAERTQTLLDVNTMTVDGLDCTGEGHDITEDHDVTLVSVGTIKAEHLVELVKETSTGSFNTEDIINFGDIVTVDGHVIDLGVNQHL